MKHNFSDNKKYYTLTYWDETSIYDNHPSVIYNYGGDYYMREYACRIPLKIKNKDNLINMFIDRHSEDEGFWLESF